MDFVELEARLTDVRTLKSFDACRKLVLAVIKLLDNTIDSDDLGSFRLFTDGDGKLTANGSWFFNDQVIKDKKATYKVFDKNRLNLDFKCYGVNKLDKRTISWSQALTPNYEDEPFNGTYPVGIDFFIPASCDRVLVVLSSNYVVRTLELHDSLTATYREILYKWKSMQDFDNKRVLHTQLWDSLDLHPINQRFYEGIFQRFISLRQHLVDGKIMTDRQASHFANRLIGRLVFCWFLRKKGFIDDSFEYFNSGAYKNDTDYYHEKLEVLFFNILNSPIADRTSTDFVTPYLNGGLFEEKDDDLARSTKLTFPKNYFDDLYKFMYSYNFTTDESTSQFQQVAIDPEMLGRIFENLLAEIIEETGEQARKANGTFYTPREVVDHMCREALSQYLENVIQPDQYLKQRLFQLIDATDREFQDQDHNWRRDWKPYKERFLSALDSVKVLDPACGSGAFPMGMLQLLVKVYGRLEPRFDQLKAKLQILEGNIFGVDIEPMAIEISRLRAWLSIVVDVDGPASHLKPLPNLDFKFVCANTLIPLSKEGLIAFGEDPALAVKLQKIRERFFATEIAQKKTKLMNDYESLILAEAGLFGESERTRQLKSYSPFDSGSSANFFDGVQMFGIEKFDIVVANPPYISSHTMAKSGQKELRDFISKTYKYAKKGWDIYIPFFERGLDVLSDTGVLIYITPDKWLAKRFGDSLRLGILSNLTSILIAGREVFTSAKVDSIVTTINMRASEVLHIYEMNDGKVALKRTVRKDSLLDPYELDYLFSNYLDLLIKIERECGTVSEIARCETSVFINDAYRLKPFISELVGEFNPSTHLRVVNTGTISKYCDRWGISKMTYLGEKYLRPVVKKKAFSQEFANAYSKKSIRPKLIVKGLNLLDACFDEYGQVIPGVPTLVVQSENEDHLLLALAIVNSTFAGFYLKERFPASSYNQGTTFTFDMINNLPLPRLLSNQAIDELITLVKKVLNAKTMNQSSDTKLYEKQINSRIYELYGLSAEEIELIEGAKSSKV